MGKKSRGAQPGRNQRNDRVAGVTPFEGGAAKVDRYPALNGLRGLAALAVFGFHAYVVAGLPVVLPGWPAAGFAIHWLLRMGWAGVDVFFTLSAFLLALPYARALVDDAAPPSLPGYAARRAMRILPAYYIQLVLLLALAAMGWSDGLFSGALTSSRVAVQFVFAYDIGSWQSGVLPLQPLVASWWTLPIEIGFYLLLPLFARLLRPRRWPWLLLGIALCWSFRALLLRTQPMSVGLDLFVEHLPGRIDQFLIGMLAAYACVQTPRWLQSITGLRADALFIVAAAVFVLLPALGDLTYGAPMEGNPHPQWLMIGWHGYASIAVAGMLIACARGAHIVGKLLDSLPLQLLGRISYGVYLWHLPVLLWMKAHGGVAAFGDRWAFILSALLFTLTAGWLSWWIVERPALRFAARWPHGARARMDSPVSVRMP